MLPKAHLTLHFRMSGSRGVITPSWLYGSWRSFLYSFSVLNYAHLSMKYSLAISNFLEEISSLSHSIVFLYLFALITEEGFLIFPCYSLELCIQIGISFLFSFTFSFFYFFLSAICNASSVNHFAILHFFFLGMVLIPASCTISWTPSVVL